MLGPSLYQLTSRMVCSAGDAAHRAWRCVSERVKVASDKSSAWGGKARHRRDICVRNEDRDNEQQRRNKCERGNTRVRIPARSDACEGISARSVRDSGG